MKKMPVSVRMGIPVKYMYFLVAFQEKKVMKDINQCSMVKVFKRSLEKSPIGCHSCSESLLLALYSTSCTFSPVASFCIIPALQAKLLHSIL